jgi:2-dehydropantoate 2-reductase
MTIQNIGIIGVGGVGGYFGGKLCELLKPGGGFHISFVARGEHLEAIQNSGLLLSSEADGDVVCRPSLATDDFGRLPPLDLCLVCVKEFDLPSALSKLEPAIGEDTIVLPLLNGVDVYSRVRTVLKKCLVLPACVYVGTHVERPGKVSQKGGACRILFGPDPLHPGFVPSEIVELFQAAGIKSEWTPEIQAEIWKKFIFICAFGLVSAAHDKTLGEILSDAALSQEVRAIMLEVVALAAASGVSLPADMVEVAFSKARGFPFAAKTSFQRDFERMERSDERDLFAGTVIRMGDALGIDVPETRSTSSILDKRKPA